MGGKKALLARVYLYNEMWEEAEKAAEEVMKSQNTLSFQIIAIYSQEIMKTIKK